MSRNPRTPAVRSNRTISFTIGCPRTSDAGPGCRIQVRGIAGVAFLSALMTGSTCTTSPTALIITMQTRFIGTRLTRSLRRGAEPGQLFRRDARAAARHHLRHRVHEAARVAARDHGGAGRPEHDTVDIERDRALLRGSVGDEHV